MFVIVACTIRHSGIWISCVAPRPFWCIIWISTIIMITETSFSIHRVLCVKSVVVWFFRWPILTCLARLTYVMFTSVLRIQIPIPVTARSTTRGFWNNYLDLLQLNVIPLTTRAILPSNLWIHCIAPCTIWFIIRISAIVMITNAFIGIRLFFRCKSVRLWWLLIPFLAFHTGLSYGHITPVIRW